MRSSRSSPAGASTIRQAGVWSWAKGGFRRRALLTAIVTANLVLVTITIYGFFVSDPGYDWLIFVEAGRRALEGGLYEWGDLYAWSYSPLLAYVFALIAPIGFVGWTALHVAALGLLRGRGIALLTFLSWPFWADLYNGNTMTFVFITAVGAFRGVGPASAVYLVLCLLMPRPVMLPLMVWILWMQPAQRTWFAVILVANALLVWASGAGDAWIRTLLGVGDAVAATSRDLGPATVLGSWWTLIGGALAVVLTIRGRIGWASLAASPYWLPQYFLMLLLELIPRSAEPEEGAPSNAVSSTQDAGR